MFGKRKLPILLILVFIILFFILTTTSCAKNLENIDIESFDNENLIDGNNEGFYLLGIARLGVLIAQILPVINLLLLILNKKNIDLVKRKNMIMANIILFFISGGINIIIEPQNGGANILDEEQQNAIRKAELTRYSIGGIMIFASLAYQISALVYIIKQKIKAKNDKIMQDV